MDGMNARPERAGSAPHAVVVGSGFGGLAAAVRLGAKGYRVTVVEKLDGPGGRAYTFRQDGFTFDAGPTILTAPHLFEELWALCGERFSDHIDLRALDPFYRIRFDDWMWVMNDGVLINRSYLKKFGITVSELTIFMQKQKP